MQIQNTTISVELTEDQAYALSQFLKRVSLSDYRRLSIDEEEAYAMLYAGNVIQESLNEAGHNPR